jgi:hypothetical protein
MIRASAVVALAGALAAVPAAAQTARPEPGCAGLNADSRGDAAYPSLDLTGFWFTHGAGRTTANLRIADLDRTIPLGATGVSWYVMWDHGGTRRFVKASIELGIFDDPVFHFGHMTDGPRQSLGETTGDFIEGDQGVISIAIPGDIGGAPASRLSTPLADTSTTLGVPGAISALQVVDEAGGRAYTVGACENAPSVPPVTAAPAQSPSQPPPAPAREIAAGRLDAAVLWRPAMARKVRRSVTVTLESKGGVRGIDAALFRGPVSRNVVVARGRVASVNRQGRLRLKVTRKLRKGTHTLQLIGRNAGGDELADRSFTLRFR